MSRSGDPLKRAQAGGTGKRLQAQANSKRRLRDRRHEQESLSSTSLQLLRPLLAGGDATSRREAIADAADEFRCPARTS